MTYNIKRNILRHYVIDSKLYLDINYRNTEEYVLGAVAWPEPQHCNFSDFCSTLAFPCLLSLLETDGSPLDNAARSESQRRGANHSLKSVRDF